MSVFTSKFNPLTGRTEWELQCDSYDFRQEIARSSYADMLHDTERNHKYSLALKKAIDAQRKKGNRIKVLDIGTGSGLLAMLAARYGADIVYACEAFPPVANCAKQVIKDNGFHMKIKLIPKRSTELSVGPGEDMEEKANILVTEVFDTELIGEGAIQTFTHALNHLLEPDCLVVPSAARIYAQAVHSPFLRSFHTLSPISLKQGQYIQVPRSVTECPGAPAVHDLQLSQLSQGDFQSLMDPMTVFRFDFTNIKTLYPDVKNILTSVAKADGVCNAILVWWDLIMDHEGEILLTCAPEWSVFDMEACQWRDHWMQAVYYPQKEVYLAQGEEFQFAACHDEYSMWFSIGKEVLPHPICSCGLHLSASRTRIGMLNDSIRNQTYERMLSKVLDKEKTCLCISDGSLLPLIAARLGAKKVYVLENETISRRVTAEFVEANDLNDKIVILNKPVEELVLDEKIDVLVGEPFFTSTLLPWHSLQFWFTKSLLSHLLTSNCQVLPHKAIIRGIGVRFKDLWKIRAPVLSAEGFNLTSFDQMIQESQDMSDDTVEPQPLWEYPAVPLTNDFDIMKFDLTTDADSKVCKNSGYVEFISSGICNGIALWIDFVFDSENVITTGPVGKIVPGQPIQWDRYTRQGVHFISPPRDVEKQGLKLLHFTFSLTPSSGEIEFAFDIVNKKFA